MDYSKVNNALSGWVGPSSRRDRAKAELGEAMQLMQAQEQIQANKDAKANEMDQWMAHIHNQASQIAVRNEDREIIQSLYDQEKSTFLESLEKHGNDPVKFLNSGGRRVLKDFYNNIMFSDDAKRISSNTSEIQKFYEQLEGDDGKNAHLISNQTRRDFNSFMNGDIDSFEHRGLQSWDHPGDGDTGYNLADRYLNTKENYMKFASNYAIEYDLSPEEALTVPRERLESYVAQYVGGGDPRKALQPTPQGSNVNKSVGARVTRQFRTINSKKISTGVIGKNSQEYSISMKNFDSGRFTQGIGPTNTDIVGHRGFVGDELSLAKASLGKDRVSDLDSYIPDVQALGTWYDEDGSSVLPGDELGDLRPGGIFLGYKIKNDDGTYNLVKSSDLEEAPKDAEHAIIQEYESDDVLWFSSNYYNEIDTNDPMVMKTYSDIKGEDTALGRYTAEANILEPETPQGPLNIDEGSDVDNLTVRAYDNQLSPILKQIGIEEGNVVAKSLIMSLSSLDGNTQEGLGYAVDRFNPSDYPELNASLVSGDVKSFYQKYLSLLVNEGGVSQSQALDYLKRVDVLRDKIQKAYNK